MSEENAPHTTVTPISIATVGPLNALIFRKTTTTHEGAVAQEILVNIKRNRVKPDDDPAAIPILEIPALIMLLKAVAEPAMTVRAVPAAPPKPAETEPCAVCGLHDTHPITNDAGRISCPVYRTAPPEDTK